MAKRAPVAELTGRDVRLIQVRPRTSGQRDALVAAAAKAKVSLSYYVLESALMVADHEGFRAPVAPGWAPRRAVGQGGTAASRNQAARAK